MFNIPPRIGSRTRIWGLLLATLGSVSANAQPFAYVANTQGNNVSVVDTSTNSVVANTTVRGGPSGVAITPDGGLVYVTTQSSNQVAVISRPSNTVVTTIPVGVGPMGVAITPSGTQAYVVNQGSDNVSVIRIPSNSVVATIPVGSRPSGVAVSPNGARALVTNIWSGELSVIDTGANYVTATIPLAVGSSGVAISPDSSFAYVTNQYTNTVSVISLNTNSVVAVVPVQRYPNSLAVAPNGSRVYVTNGNSRSVSVIDTGSRAVIANIEVGANATAVAITADGSRAYVTNALSYSVSVIDTASNSVIATLNNLGIFPVAVAITPSGGGQPQPLPPPPPPCTYSLSPNNLSFPSGGGNGSATINASAGNCGWTASVNAGWVIITSSSSGNGSGVLNFFTSPNSSTDGRSATLTVAGQNLNISQSGAAPVPVFPGIRVNCGGPGFTDSFGRFWAGDESGNQTKTTAGIGGADFPTLYQSERWAADSLQYSFPVPNGSYNVRLKFAELYLTRPGQRTFNIVINGNTVLYNFDVFGEAGRNRAIDKTFPVPVSGGQITIQLVALEGNPKVNAIEIY